MIHDVTVEVTCDGFKLEKVNVPLDFVYPNLSSQSGYFDHRPESIERRLKSEHDWAVVNGKHFCCAECVR